jgi:hypothetical protein
MRTRTWAVGTLIVAAVAVVVVGFTVVGPRLGDTATGYSPRSGQLKDHALQACKRFVEQRVADPVTFTPVTSDGAPTFHPVTHWHPRQKTYKTTVEVLIHPLTLRDVDCTMTTSDGNRWRLTGLLGLWLAPGQNAGWYPPLDVSPDYDLCFRPALAGDPPRSGRTLPCGTTTRHPTSHNTVTLS